MSIFPDYPRKMADAARETRGALLSSLPDDFFNPFALYIDSGIMSVSRAA
ncbi:hypothetical protein [Burkholderia sp. S-53]|nr:hypothetical protein [Burkholderia sp. S-53]UXU85713.1 hypothetical protein LXM88_04960 [Burkholderia sp. S-53]